MKNDGAKIDQVSDSFTRRLNNVIFDLNRQLTNDHLAGVTGPTILEINMTQGMINNAYIQPKRKLDIE